MQIKNLRYSLLIGLLSALTAIIFINNVLITKVPAKTASAEIKTVSSNIYAAGSIKSQNEATLHFLTGGKLVYLPFKAGDPVYAGQTIAQLDTFTIQKQLTAALNNYRISRDTFDQTQDNANSGVLQGAQKYGLTVTNKGGFDVPSVMGDMVKRIVDQSQANLDNSVINVELANYAYQMATLNAPFDGIIYRQDVTSPQIMVSPANSFTIIDPNALIFKANIPESDIDFIEAGAPVNISLDAVKNRTFNGTVTKIYPDKVTLATGAHVYQADIESPELLENGKYDMAGAVTIKSNLKNSVALVPTWLILNSRQIWVKENRKAVLRTVTTGKRHGGNTEVLSGLLPNDQLITNPQYLAEMK